MAIQEKSPRDYTINEAQQAVHKAQPKEALANQLFIDGDHWQATRGWVGPMPAPTERDAPIVIGEIERAFTSRNVTLEVAQRHSGGVAGREPAWAYVPRRPLADDEEPSTEEQTAIDEAEAPVTTWWNDRGLPQLVQDAAEMVLHQSRALLRLYIPKGLLTEKPAAKEGEPATLEATASTLEEALAMIHVDMPHPSSAAVVRDPDTMQPVGIHVFRLLDRTYADISYVEGEETVVRRVGGSKEEDYSYRMGGRLLMHQMARRLMITQQVQQQQRALNLAESMIPRGVVTQGFLELIITAAQMPGEFVDDDTMPTGRRFVPGAFHRGPGTTNFLAGQEVVDLDGNRRVTTPGVNFRPPIGPEASVAARDAHYRSILDEVDQTHHVITGDATASAVSRVEARLDFLNSLRATQAPLEELGRWLLEAVLALAEEIMGTPGKYTSLLRADFTCRLQVGQLTADEQRVLAEMVEKGLVDRETAMSLLGIDDVDAAIARINSQPGAMLEMREKQAAVVAAWMDAGMSVAVAAQLAGMDPESDEYKLLTKPVDPTVDQVVEQ